MRSRPDSAARKIRVLIADDHAVLRAGLRLLIGAQPDMELVAEAQDRDSTVRLARETAPDVALVDLTMPGGGMGAIEDLTAQTPGVRVLVLTMHDDPAYLRTALAAGAAGYVVKKAADTELLSSLRAVHHGATIAYLSRARSAVKDLAATDAGRRRIRRGALSAREREVLVYLARGYTNRQIGEELALSTKSVETYRGRLARKLGLRTRADIVSYALGTGLLGSEASSGDRPVTR